MDIRTHLEPLEADAAEYGLVDPVAHKWFALHEAAAIVNAMAGLKLPSRQSEVQDFPAAIRAAGGWRYQWVKQDLDDLSAMLQAGLAALLALQARGIKAAALAAVLWQEFIAGRDALISLLPSPSDQPKA